MKCRSPCILQEKAKDNINRCFINTSIMAMAADIMSDTGNIGQGHGVFSKRIPRTITLQGLTLAAEK